MKKYKLKSAAAALMVAVCAIVSPALAQAPRAATETAALTPRDTGIETRDRLPSVLTARDADLYSRIFAVQEAGRLDQADRLIAELGDDVLMGHVLFQRYMHPTAHRSSFRELQAWLDLYADHPGAERIHELAMRRKPADARPPARPAGPEIPTDLLMSDDAEQVNTAALSAPRPKGPNASAILRHQQRVRAMVRSGSVTGALKHLETAGVARLFDPVSHDQSLADIARGYYVQNKDAEALSVAAKAANRSGAVVPIAHWWAGLAAWRMQDHDRAAEHFEALARNEQATDWSRAAGGFWAARAYLVGERPQRVNEMLRLASNHPRTFYGLLATRALGLTPGFDWHAGLDTPGPEQELLTRLPGARRALALLQAGERLRAEQELRSFTLVDSAPLTRVILTLADRAGMAEVAFRVGSAMERRLGARFDAAVFPIPAWEPETGFAIDRALVYAFIRQESQFRPDAVSSAGARGLMQLMPATARYVAGRSLSRSDLNDPATNIELGQRYLEKLIKDPVIGGNLFFVAAAYNGGPGNLQKWMRSARYADDPLLFIESIPSQETRIFIERVLTNYWIYRIRMGQATPSLEGVLRGDWPIYSEQDAFAPAESVALQPAAGPGPDPLYAEWPR